MANNIDSLLLNPQTRLQIKYLLDDPPQVLLISANSGSGKKTLAKTIAATLLQIPSGKNIEDYHYFFYVKRLKNKSDIAIEQIRALIDALKLKTPGPQKIKRVVFIENAQHLSIPAQNSLLKILEEPSSDTVFLLSTNSVQNVLPTISSRAQKLDVQQVNLDDTVKHWQSDYSKKDIESAWRLSGGTVGLMHALLSENSDHKLRMAVEDVKNFIKGSRYQRLLQAEQLGRNKEQFQLFLDALSRTLNFLHHSAVNNNKISQSHNLLASRKTVQKAYSALLKNGNTKLIALELVLGLKI